MLNGLLREYKNNLIWWLERVSYIEVKQKNKTTDICTSKVQKNYDSS